MRPSDQADRHEVQQQHVLGHVHREDLLGERVDRRDERDERCTATPPQEDREPADLGAAAARARRGARAASAARRRRDASTRTIGPGARERGSPRRRAPAQCAAAVAIVACTQASLRDRAAHRGACADARRLRDVARRRLLAPLAPPALLLPRAAGVARGDRCAPRAGGAAVAARAALPRGAACRRRAARARPGRGVRGAWRRWRSTGPARGARPRAEVPRRASALARPHGRPDGARRRPPGAGRRRGGARARRRPTRCAGGAAAFDHAARLAAALGARGRAAPVVRALRAARLAAPAARPRPRAAPGRARRSRCAPAGRVPRAAVLVDDVHTTGATLARLRRRAAFGGRRGGPRDHLCAHASSRHRKPCVDNSPPRRWPRSHGTVTTRIPAPGGPHADRGQGPQRAITDELREHVEKRFAKVDSRSPSSPRCDVELSEERNPAIPDASQGRGQRSG